MADITQQDLQQQMLTEFSALAHKHATVSYSLIGILALVLALGGLGAWLGFRSYEAQLAKAEAVEAQYIQDRNVWAQTLAQHDTQRAQEAQAQQVVIKVVDTRDKVADQAIQQIVKPDATLQDDSKAVWDAFKDVPAFQGSLPSVDAQHVLLDGSQAQQVAVYKLDRDRLSANFDDGKKYLALEQSKNDTLTKDLAQCNTQNTESQKVIDAYKRAAIKSKWRRILDNSEKVALIAGGIFLGKKL